MEECPLPEYIEDKSPLNVRKYPWRLLMDDTVSIRSKSYIFLKEPLEILDVFVQTKATNVRYYVRAFKGFTNKALYQYEVRRVDEALMSPGDLSRLTKNKKIFINGHMHVCKNCK